MEANRGTRVMLELLELLPQFPPVGPLAEFNLMALSRRLGYNVDTIRTLLHYHYDLPAWQARVQKEADDKVQDFALPSHTTLLAEYDLSDYDDMSSDAVSSDSEVDSEMEAVSVASPATKPTPASRDLSSPSIFGSHEDVSEPMEKAILTSPSARQLGRNRVTALRIHA